MKRIGLGIAVLLVAALGLGQTAHAAGVNDFSINQFDADYYLGIDSNNRSTLKTVERITAQFPMFNQNHGIERALPQSYDGHTTHLKIESVTDSNNTPINYSTYESNDNLVLRIGEASKYVQGIQNYIITYTQRDVTRYFADTRSDEFYWDINGTEWMQPFGEVRARLHVDGNLRQKMSGNMVCYKGVVGSNQQCSITDDGSVIIAGAMGLGRGENMTIAVGFAGDTFAAYEPSTWEKIVAFVVGLWIITTVATSVIGFIMIFVISIRYSRRSNRTKDIGTIVAEYIPPKEASVLTSAKIADGTRADLTAQIIDLAVRHYLKLYQTKEKSLWKAAEYELEIVKSISDLSVEEQSFLKTLFGSKGTNIGARFAMKSLKNDYTIAAKFQKNAKVLENRIKKEYGLRHKVEAESKWFKNLGIISLIIGVVTLSPLLIIAAIIALVCGHQLYPLTDKGVDLRRYLEGLKLYIGVAEQERLKMLQSPEGAEKVGTGVADDPKKLVKLYERVLPYAVLFGQEKEWNKRLGEFYEQDGSSPDWYSGHAAFNAAVFTSAMNDFSSTTTSYGASSSSSSGGSSGGGSSGGGGGGGGGGGW